MDDQLSAVELSNIDRKIRHNPMLILRADLARRLYDMAMRPTDDDEKTERLNDKIGELQRDCEDLRRELAKAREICRVMEIDHKTELRAVQTEGRK